MNIACEINDEIFYKRFIYYTVNHEAKFYTLLKADTTNIQREQQKQGQQLKNALDLATEATHQVERANIAHEIQTPINAVLGMNEMIIRESQDDRITTYARNIESAGKNLLSIINDILDFSKI